MDWKNLPKWKPKKFSDMQWKKQWGAPPLCPPPPPQLHHWCSVLSSIIYKFTYDVHYSELCTCNRPVPVADLLFSKCEYPLSSSGEQSRKRALKNALFAGVRLTSLTWLVLSLSRFMGQKSATVIGVIVSHIEYDCPTFLPHIWIYLTSLMIHDKTGEMKL